MKRGEGANLSWYKRLGILISIGLHAHSVLCVLCVASNKLQQLYTIYVVVNNILQSVCALLTLY